MAKAARSSVAAVPRPYRGVSATDRRDRRRQRLIDAGLQLFGTRGIAAVGIVSAKGVAALPATQFPGHLRQAAVAVAEFRCAGAGVGRIAVKPASVDPSDDGREPEH